MASTRSGQCPCSSAMSSSSRCAYSVVLKYHWVSCRLVTVAPQRSQAPLTTCSLASTVWSFGHQFTYDALRWASPRSRNRRNSHWVQR